MTKHIGEDRREGLSDRRKSPWWFWVGGIAVLVGTAVNVGVALNRNAIPEVVIPDHTVALESLSTQLETLTLRQPEVHTLVTERIIRDTVFIPYEVAMEPQIVRVHDTTEVLVFRVDTLWMPPQIVTIPVPERTFWSAETYAPSIGNTVWSLGGVALGMFLHGVVFPTAKACVVVNIDVMVFRDEMCNL